MFVMTVHVEQQWSGDFLLSAGSLQRPFLRAELQWSITERKVHLHRTAGESHHNPILNCCVFFKSVLGKNPDSCHHLSYLLSDRVDHRDHDKAVLGN